MINNANEQVFYFSDTVGYCIHEQQKFICCKCVLKRKMHPTYKRKDD